MYGAQNTLLKAKSKVEAVKTDNLNTLLFITIVSPSNSK